MPTHTTPSHSENDYQRIAHALHYLLQHHTRQPSLAEVAAQVALSPEHFQKLFQRWAGISPKKFAQFLTLQTLKARLQCAAQPQSAPLLAVADEAGLSSTGRLHDWFVTLEGMSPGEYQRGGAALSLDVSHAPTPFGEVLIASSPRGICHLRFYEDLATALAELRHAFPNAQWREHTTSQPLPLHATALAYLHHSQASGRLALHVKGTSFQLKVWQALLQIPFGALSSYGQLAQDLNHHSAARAVGGAVGANPVAVLIPCHRVIQSSGALNGYRWGVPRKAALLGWEWGKCEENE